MNLFADNEEEPCASAISCSRKPLIPQERCFPCRWEEGKVAGGLVILGETGGMRDLAGPPGFTLQRREGTLAGPAPCPGAGHLRVACVASTLEGERARSRPAPDLYYSDSWDSLYPVPWPSSPGILFFPK